MGWTDKLRKAIGVLKGSDGDEPKTQTMDNDAIERRAFELKKIMLQSMTRVRDYENKLLELGERIKGMDVDSLEFAVLDGEAKGYETRIRNERMVFNNALKEVNVNSDLMSILRADEMATSLRSVQSPDQRAIEEQIEGIIGNIEEYIQQQEEISGRASEGVKIITRMMGEPETPRSDTVEKELARRAAEEAKKDAYGKSETLPNKNPESPVTERESESHE